MDERTNQILHELNQLKAQLPSVAAYQQVARYMRLVADEISILTEHDGPPEVIDELNDWHTWLQSEQQAGK